VYMETRSMETNHQYKWLYNPSFCHNVHFTFTLLWFIVGYNHYAFHFCINGFIILLEGLQLGVSLSLMARIAMARTVKSRSREIARWTKSRSSEIVKQSQPSD
jgi:hypothetical protein